MINILLCGANGRMGRVISELAARDEAFGIAAGVDVAACATYGPFPVFGSIREAGDVSADVIIDFSYHTAVEGILTFALEHRLPAVVATTGHTDDELAIIKAASTKIPIFKSGNMSLGVNLMTELVRRAAAALDGYDIEIIERHHNHKLDAPSGTALMLADAAREGLKFEPEYVYDRHSVRRERGKQEIGIHSVRGGNIVGMHEVMFAGPDEVISISHTAQSRDVFAHGALRAASFIVGKPAGMYSMRDIVNEIDL